MRRISPISFSLTAVAFLLLLLLTMSGAEAQSGRRAPKSPSPSQPTPTPTPAATPVKPVTQPQISLVVVGDIPQSLYFSFPFPERMQTWVTKRLRDSTALSVVDGGRGNRKEAINRAKAATEVYIIFLQLDAGNFARSSSSGTNMEEVYISYSILSPVTGKAKTGGVVYLGRGGSPVGLGGIRTGPTCYPGVTGNDLYLLEASLAVADRIMGAFNLPTPPVCP
jgi:hypothetical protein